MGGRPSGRATLDKNPLNPNPHPSSSASRSSPPDAATATEPTSATLIPTVSPTLSTSSTSSRRSLSRAKSRDHPRQSLVHPPFEATRRTTRGPQPARFSRDGVASGVPGTRGFRDRGWRTEVLSPPTAPTPNTPYIRKPGTCCVSHHSQRSVITSALIFQIGICTNTVVTSITSFSDPQIYK